MAEKLTDRTAKTSNFADADVFHLVDVSDTSQDPAGSSFKVSINDIFGNYLAPRITSAQFIANAADTYSVTLADTVSSNHYLFVQTASNNPFVNVTVNSYTSPKDGAIVVVRLNQNGSGDLDILGDFIATGGFSAGIYTLRYIGSLSLWTNVNFVPEDVVQDFTDLGDVPSSYTGQGGKVVQVKDDESGLEFGQAEFNLKVSLTAAQIKTANSVPIDVGLPASGAGFYYRVTAFDVKVNYNSAAFACGYIAITATSKLAATGDAQCRNEVVDASSNTFAQSVFQSGNGLAENDTLLIFTETDSAVGDSTIDCYITVVKVAL